MDPQRTTNSSVTDSPDTSRGSMAPRAGGTPEWLSDMLERLESDDRWDPVAEALDTAGKPLAEGPTGAALRGDWMGHALHPLMTDLPLGCWQAATLLDLFGGRMSRKAARRLIGFGVLTAMPTAVTGLVELASVEDPRIRRVGAVHAAGNTVALGLYALSFRTRRKDRHLTGVALALAGGSVAMFTGYLGGHMSFGRGAGVEARGMDGRSGTEPASPRSTRAAAPDQGMVDDRSGPQPIGADEVRGMGHANLMGVEQVARELTVPVEQVHTMMVQGLLPAAQTDPLRFRSEDVQAVRLQGG